MNVGDTVHIITTWRTTVPADYPTITRVLADPTTLTCVLTAPSSATVTFTYPASITKASAGVFYVEHIVNEAGTWVASWTATGAAAGVERKSFPVAA